MSPKQVQMRFLHRENDLKDYKVITDGIRLDRRYFKGATVSLTAEQAKYLIMNSKIALKDEEQTQE
jgi:hypothetical protein